MSWNAPDASLGKFAERALQIAVVVAAVWGLCNLITGAALAPLDLDEAGSWFIAGRSPSEAIERSLHMADKLPAYYTLLSLWKEWVGSSSFAMRSLSLLCIALSAMYVTLLGRLVAPGYGLVTAASFILSSFVLGYAFEVLPYAFLMLATLALTYSVRSVYVGGGRSDFLKSIAWGACLAYTHLSGALYLAALAFVILLVAIKRRATAQSCALLRLVVAFGFVLAPLSLVALKIMEDKAYVSYGTSLTLPTFSHVIVNGLRSDVIAATLFMFVLVCVRREKLVSPDGMFLFLVAVPCLHILISALLGSTIAPGYFSIRYSIAAFAVLTCATSFLFRLADSRWQRVGMLLGALSISLVFGFVTRKCGSFGPDWSQASRNIREVRAAREGRCSVLFCGGYVGSVHAFLLTHPIWGGLFVSPFSYHREHGCDLIPIPGDISDHENLRFFVEVTARKVAEGREVFMALPRGWIVSTPTRIYPFMMTSHCESLKPFGLGCQEILPQASEVSVSRVVPKQN